MPYDTTRTLPAEVSAEEVSNELALMINTFLTGLDDVTQEWCRCYDQQLRVHAELPTAHLEECLLERWCEHISRTYDVELTVADIMHLHDAQSLAYAVLAQHI